MTISEINFIIKKLESVDINNTIYINETNIIHTINEFNDCILKIVRFSENTYIFIICKASTAGSLELSSHDFPRLTNSQFYFLNQLMKNKKNSINYVFHTSDECPILKNFIFDFYNLKVNNGIHLKNIFLMGSDLYAKYYINKMNIEHGTPLFSYSLKWDLVNHAGIDSISTSDSLFLSKDIKKYKTTCLFGRIDGNRIKFSYKLYKVGFYKNNNLYTTFANQYGSDKSDSNIEYTKYKLRKMGIASNDIGNFINESRLGYHHTSEEILTPSLMRFVPENNDSYLWITSESIPTVHDVMFITEKTLKAFLWYKPLIVYSIPNTIKLLKYIGFIDVFELMGFDSSYDLEEDDDIRLDMIVSQIDKFQKTPISEIHERYNDKNVQDSLIHNNLLFKKLIGTDENLHNRGGETVTNKTIITSEYLLNRNMKSDSSKNNINSKFDSDFKLFFK